MLPLYPHPCLTKNALCHLWSLGDNHGFKQSAEISNAAFFEMISSHQYWARVFEQHPISAIYMWKARDFNWDQNWNWVKTNFHMMAPNGYAFVLVPTGLFVNNRSHSSDLCSHSGRGPTQKLTSSGTVDWNQLLVDQNSFLSLLCNKMIITVSTEPLLKSYMRTLL